MSTSLDGSRSLGFEVEVGMDVAFFLIVKGWEAMVGDTEDVVRTIMFPLMTQCLAKAEGLEIGHGFQRG